MHLLPSRNKRARDDGSLVWIRRSLQGWTIRPFPGLVSLVPAVAYHFCLNLPAVFSQTGNGLVVKPCTRPRIMQPRGNFFEDHSKPEELSNFLCQGILFPSIFRSCTSPASRCMEGNGLKTPQVESPFDRMRVALSLSPSHVNSRENAHVLRNEAAKCQHWPRKLLLGLI